MINDSLFSSDRMDWETPKDFFNKYDKIYHFTLDVCARSDNAKCKNFFSPIDNSLTKDWSGNVCWMNPPYGREIIYWVKKAYEESQKPNTTVVGLLPSRTDTKWFHEYVLGKAQIEFIRGRIKFVGANSSAPFPSIVVKWGNNE